MSSSISDSTRGYPSKVTPRGGRRTPPLADEYREKKQRPPRIPPRPEDLVNARKARVCSQPSHATPDAPRRANVMDTPTTMHAVATMQMTARAFCKKRDPAAGLGVMLVGKGGVADEGGGGSPSSSRFLQLVRVPERERCAGAAAPTCAGGRTGGTRGRLRRVGLLRLDSGQPMVREAGVDLSRH